MTPSGPMGVLPVVDGRRVIGRLTQSDVAAALARQESP
jgi:CBS-domain-containing membrane protein